MKISMEEFDGVSKGAILNILITKKESLRIKKNMLNAERNVLKEIVKYVNNDETIQLGGWQNIKLNLLEQIGANLNLAMRYLRDNEMDCIAKSYLKNCQNLCRQYQEKNSDEYFLSLNEKYVDNAYKYIPEEKLV